MKKILAFFLACLMAASLFGCRKTEPEAQGPAFYYCAADITYGMDSQAIQSEQRADAEGRNLEETLTLYLAGPASDTLRSPFPAGLQVVEVHSDASSLYITLNDVMATLSGLELTVACSCLCLTGLGLSGAEKVVISAQDALLDGQRSITMDADSLLLLDTVLEGE